MAILPACASTIRSTIASPNRVPWQICSAMQYLTRRISKNGMQSGRMPGLIAVYFPPEWTEGSLR